MNSWDLEVPYALSLLVYNEPYGEIKGIKELQHTAQQTYGAGSYTPDVPGLFWSFRLMIALGVVMVLALLSSAFLLWKNKLQDNPFALKLLVFLIPLPYIANSLGWYITEGGRQPWMVVGLQKVSAAVSLNITPTEVMITMVGFTLVYLFLAIAAVYIAVKFIQKDPVDSLEGGGK